jgi:hypothetical protein
MVKASRVAKRFSLVVLLVTFALAQQPTPPRPQAQSAIPSTGDPGLDRYRASRIAVFSNDFGELSVVS